MYMRIAIIALVKMIYKTNSYSMRNNVVPRNDFISETTPFQ